MAEREETMKIVFTESRVVYDENNRPIKAFEEHELVELPRSSAERWLRRNAAIKADEVPAEPAPEPGSATIEEVLGAMEKLSEEDYTDNGLPKVEALRDHLDGKRVTSQQRDMAWVKFKPKDAKAKG